MSRRRNVEVVPLMDKDDDWKEQDLEDLVLNDILDNIKQYPQVVSYRQLRKSIILISLASFILGIITSYYFYNAFNANNSTIQVAKRNYIHMKENLYEDINHKNIEEYYRILQKTTNEELLLYIKNTWLKEGLDTVNIMSYNFLTSSSEGRLEQLSVIESIQNNSENTKDEKNHFYEAKCIYCDCPFIKDKTVIGNLVYANYARFSDFLQLQELNINVSKKIIISQIGEIPIISKLFIAKQFGATGLILFPDQRTLNASVNSSAAEDDQVHAGHCSELLHIKEISYEEDGQLKTSFQTIPVFLISFEEATNFLRQMAGPKFPDDWIINDTFSYKLGPGFENNNKVKLEVKIENDRNQTDYIIIGKILGGRETDRSVMIGISKQFGQLRGISTLLEIARIFGNVLKNGRRPRRNILFCIWGFSDTESFSFYKWIIENQKKLEGELVSYIDVSSLKTPKIISTPLLYEKVLNIMNKISKINKIEKNLKWLKRINDDTSENCIEGNSFDPFYYEFGIPTIHFKFNWNLYNVISGQILLETIQSLSDDSVLSFTYEEYTSYFKDATNYLEKQYNSFFKENGTELNSLKLAIKEFFQAEEVFLKNLRINSENSNEIRSINDILVKTERAMISFNNFPLRKNYRHILFGINTTNICNIISFPGIDNLYFHSKIKPEKPFQDDVTKHIATIAFHIESLTKILHGSL